MYVKSFLISAFFAFLTLQVQGQDPLRFEKTINEFKEEKVRTDKRPIIFTGSSSVRIWRSINEDFPKHYIINRGFGGSHMSDVQYFLEDLVLADNPRQVFIYEGDNDIASGKSKEVIMEHTKDVCDRILAAIPDVEILLISPKPSVARWNLKAEYMAINKAMQEYAEMTDQVTFIDVWAPALDESGHVFTDIFLDDKLHMNDKGYDIWRSVIGPYLATP